MTEAEIARIVIWFGIIGITLVLIAKAIVFVPTFKVGAVRRFGALTGRTLQPGGPYFIWPFIEDRLLKSVEDEGTTIALQRKSVNIKVISSDRLQVLIEGSIQYRLDPALLQKFLEVGKDAWEGLIDAIKSELGIIAGKKKADSFIERRGAIQDLINCVLRLEISPHQNPSILGTKLSSAPIPPEERLEFYEENISSVKTLLKKERENHHGESTVEKRYGIEVITFELFKVDFSDDTLQALEAERQAKAKMDAAQVLANRKLEIFRRLREEGLGLQEAINEASVTIEQAEKKVFSVEGLRDLFGRDKQ